MYFFIPQYTKHWVKQNQNKPFKNNNVNVISVTTFSTVLSSMKSHSIMRISKNNENEKLNFQLTGQISALFHPMFGFA